MAENHIITILMGYVDDVMEIFMQKDLQNRFPVSDGWKHEIKPLGKPNDLLFVYSRTNRGVPERSAVMVCMDPAVDRSSVDQFSALCTENPKWTRKLILVPKSADVANVPASLAVQEMKSFGYVDGRLTWLTRRKNTPKYPAELPSAA
jgi:hypothetical protein